MNCFQRGTVPSNAANRSLLWTNTSVNQVKPSVAQTE